MHLVGFTIEVSQNNLCSIRSLECKLPEERRSAIQPACVKWDTIWIFNMNHKDKKSECKISGSIAQLKATKLSENMGSGDCWGNAYWRITLKLIWKDFQKYRTYTHEVNDIRYIISNTRGQDEICNLRGYRIPVTSRIFMRLNYLLQMLALVICCYLIQWCLTGNFTPQYKLHISVSWCRLQAIYP